MQFPSWKWVQCGRQQGAQNIEKLNLRFQLWSIYAARSPWPVFLLSWFQVQEVVDELCILLQENALIKKTQEQRWRYFLQHLQKYNMIQRGYDYRHKPCTQ